METTNCLIIGGGPTGLTLGISLLQQGKSVIIIEKRKTSIEYSRAVLVNSETLKLLEPSGKKIIIIIDNYNVIIKIVEIIDIYNIIIEYL
jgi:anaerobic glycerol-3-phosphate dehydrogenase